MNDGLGKTGPVTVTLGKSVNTLIENGFKEAHLHHAMDGLLLVIAAQPAQFGDETEKAFHRHVGVSRGVFREIADEPFGADGVIIHVMAADGNLAFGGRNKARNHAHGGGFARAVGPEEPKDFASFHRKRNMVHGHFWAE